MPWEAFLSCGQLYTKKKIMSIELYWQILLVQVQLCLQKHFLLTLGGFADHYVVSHIHSKNHTRVKVQVQIWLAFPQENQISIVKS